MENRFVDMDTQFKRISRTRGLRENGPPTRAVADAGSGATSLPFSQWATPLSTANRVLVILIENGGIDLGIPELVDKLLTGVPAASVLPDSYRQKIIDFIRQKIREVTDNLLESGELAINRYTAAKPDKFSDVIVLRDGTASYLDLKRTLIAQSQAGKTIDVFILTHGASDQIWLSGASGIDGKKIRDMRAENGAPLSIRSVYMMNCVGSSLNGAWLDAGARVSSGSIRNNYLPEPTTFFFWNNWKAGQSFETAVTSAYRKTINIMNEAVRGFLRTLPLPGAVSIADAVDFESLDFVKDSAPVVQGQRSLTISSDDLTSSRSTASSLATTVLSLSVLRALAVSRVASAPPTKRTVSSDGIELIKRFEGFMGKMYNDPAGHCTIGYGTLLHAGNCDGRATEQPYANGISDDSATQLLTQRMREFEQIVNDSVKVQLNQSQHDALASFVYNIGGGNFQKSTLLKRLNQSEYGAVPTEMRKWTKAYQDGNLVDLPRLVKRREVEAALFQRPDSETAQSLSWIGRAEYARSFSGVDYSIPGMLPVIAQPKPNACWATVYAMLYSWKTNASVEIRNALAAAGARYVEIFDRDNGLDAASAKTFYQDVGLVPITSFNPTTDGWEQLLRKYGPLYIDVGYDAPYTGTHATIVTGISGDGSADGTSITYVDPYGGKTVTLKFRDFIAKYEAQSAVEWPYVIVHWPPGAQVSTQASLPVTHSHVYRSPSNVVQQSDYSLAQTPAAALVAGMEIADAAQIGLGAVAVVQAQVSASQGSFSLTYDKAQRILSNEARAKMPGSQKAKLSYSLHLLYLSIGRLNSAEADIIIEWEGDPYGEISTPVIRRNLATSTEWSKSSANITVSRIERIPLPKTDPRTWPIVYTYEGTYDPVGNGYFEFSGEFEVNAFGGLKFNRHEVVSRSLMDWAIGGSPEDKVAKGDDVIVAVPEIPKDQLEYLRAKLP